MKKLITALFFVLFATALNAQSNNTERLQQIPTEINAAVEAGDFDKAAELKREREIREQIQAAIEAGDFDKAAELKAQLNGNTAPAKVSDETNNTGDIGITKKTGTPKKKTATPDSKNAVRENKITSNGVFIEALIGSANYQYAYYVDNPFGPENFVSGYENVSALAIGFKFGNKFYFGGKDNPFRIGLNVHWVELNALLGGFHEPSVQIAVVNPGIGAAWAFNRSLGVEANLNFGFSSLFIGDFEDQSGANQIGGYGVGFTPQVKFRFRALAVGFESNILNAINIETMNSRIFGVTIGAKF